MNTLSRLIGIGKKYWIAFSISFVCMILESFVSLMPPWLVKIAVDGLNMPDREGRIFLFPKQLKNLIGSPSTSIHVNELLGWVPFLILGAYILDGFFKYVNQYFIKYVGISTVRDIRNKLHEHIQGLSLSQVTKEMSGAYVSRITNDLLSIQHWVAQTITTIFNDTSKAIFLFLWLLCINWSLTLITVIVIPLFILPVLNIAKNIRKLSRKGQDNIGDLGGFVQESLQNLKVTQAYNLQKNRDADFAKINAKLFSTLTKTNAFEALISPIAGVIGAAGIAFVFWLGMRSVTQNDITLGDFSSYFLTTVLLYEPLKRLSKIWSTLQQALGASERVFEILDMKSTLVEIKNAPSIKNIKGHIKFVDVSFTYPDGNKVLRNINLEISPGEKVAVVGQSGVGKTTLISLIPRFYDPSEGFVEIDGIDIKTVSIHSLRDQIALVTQEQTLFNISIRENILLGKPNATEEELIEASKKAHVIEFVEKFQDGFDTVVGESGMKLSGGQRQRVALARAFLRNAPILILDEPTSHLDKESEEFVQEAIDELVKNRTVIIIAHRQSTIDSADKVITVERGRIASVQMQKAVTRN